MRVLVAANLTPFLRGGALDHVHGLVRAFREAGHAVECLQMPFSFNPEGQIRQAMSFARALDMRSPSGQQIDRMVALQFPVYAIQHPDAIVWVMHQHRSVYELFEPDRASTDLCALREEIIAFDEAALRPVEARGRLYANSGRVAERLKRFNQISATPLYHPPPDADRFFCDDPLGLIFFPSRFESLKRQLLVIEAAQYMKSPLKIVLAGEGGQFDAAKALVERLQLTDRVKLLGRVSASEKILWLSLANAVCYATRDEDYGYVTLEAMLSSKPLIVCNDAGGPLEFVIDQENGLVVEPEARAIAEAFDWIHAHPTRAKEMGQAGLARYSALGVSWPHVVETLLSV